MFQIRAPHLHSSCCYFLPARHWLFLLVLAVTDNTTVNIHVQTSICSSLMVSSRDGIARSKAIFREFWSTCRHLTLLQTGQAGFISLHCWKRTFEQTLPCRARIPHLAPTMLKIQGKPRHSTPSTHSCFPFRHLLLRGDCTSLLFHAWPSGVAPSKRIFCDVLSLSHPTG